MKKTTTNRKGTTTMKTGLLALALVGGAAVSGCGQTSYFEVALTVTPDPGLSCLSKIYTCEVSVTGADSGYFSLADEACRMPKTSNLGLFQFSTEKDSGSVNFSVLIVDGVLKTLGMGSGSANIKAGGRQPLTINITPDDAAFAAAQCK